MRDVHEHQLWTGVETGGARGDERGTPGKVSLTQRMAGYRGPRPAEPLEIAARGLAGPASPFPYRDQIESAFGRSLNATAHTDAEAAAACDDLGAEAFASGTGVAFRDQAPSLHTAAHEAAHVVQQAAGVHLRGSVGMVGDPYEVQADQAADLVVAGRSAAHLFAGVPAGGAAPDQVQRKVGTVVQRQPPGGAATGPAGAAPTGAPSAAPGAMTPAQQAFFNRTVEANSAVGVCGGRFSAWLSSMTIAYANAWSAHQRGLQSAEQAAKDANALVIAVILAGAGGAVGGAVGDVFRNLGGGAAVVDGMKDLAKFASRSTGTAAADLAGRASGPSGLRAMPPNPLAWSQQINLRVEVEVLTPAREIVRGWQHALNTDPEHFDTSFDPVGAVNTTLTAAGRPLSTLEPEDSAALQVGFERGFLNDWIESQAFRGFVSLSQFSWGKARDKLIQYGLSIPMPDVQARLDAAVSRGVQDNNRRAMESGHGLI